MNMNDIFEFMKQGADRNNDFPWRFIGIKDNALLQVGGGSSFTDEIFMMLVHIESLREIIKRHGDEIGFILDANNKKAWMGFLTALYLGTDIDASGSETTLYKTLLNN